MTNLGFRSIRFSLGVFLLSAAPLVSVAQQSQTGQPGEQTNQAFTTAKGVAEYRLGGGDELGIRIWTGVEVKEYTVTVQADGTIFLPFVGLSSLKAAGLSALQLRDDIIERLRVSYRQPAAEVVITKRVARVVTLLGEIRSSQRSGTGPGRYPVPGRIRLVDFITEHGGLTDQADLNKAQLMRNGESYIYNLSRAIFESDESQNPILDDLDLVFVPSLSRSSRKFLIFGEVNRPGLLELPDTGPVAEIIAQAGGFTKDAHTSHVVVVRGELGNPELLAANFEALKQGDLAQNFMLENGDMVFVGRRKLTTFYEVMRAFAQPLNILVTTTVLANTLKN